MMKPQKRFEKSLQQPFPNCYETKAEVCARRNHYLVQFFSRIKEDIHLINNPEDPDIVMNKRFAISAYVHNFHLRFTDKIYDGNVIQGFKLSGTNYIKQKEFDALLKQMEVIKLLRLKYKDTNLYLSGYNFQNRIELEGKYPVFSRHDYKLYFKRERAGSVIEQFKDYPLVLD